MSSRCLQFDDYELARTSTYSSEDYETTTAYRDEHDDDDHESLPSALLLPSRDLPLTRVSAFASRFPYLASTWFKNPVSPRRNRPHLRRITRRCTCSLRSFYRKLAILAYAFVATILTSIVVCGAFFPSYTHLPRHYKSLRQEALASTEPGRVNARNEKVFIAASIFDKGGKLSTGPWADNVLGLIELLGPQNTFLSIYVNDAGPEAREALQSLERRVPCDHDLVFEEHLPLDDLPHIHLPDGSRRLKRIEYLAEVRNRALRPLDVVDTVFDKLLYLNDVVFHPIDAAQLLFSTHAGADGSTDYRAACAVDFISPFKFYDTFATRDMEGFGVGLPFFPWFSAGGSEQSHQDVLDGSDAVRVRSCWGGMVAFDAQFFQPRLASTSPPTAGHLSPSNLSAPFRFRAESELYWEASECCLIQADIQNPEPGHSGIFMNPFVRVAYDTKTLSWLRFLRRFERLYTPIHFMLDILISAPAYNPRRDEEPWQEVDETTWVPDETLVDGGSFQAVGRLASHDGFCGRKSLSVIKDNITKGERNWESLPVPS